MNVRPDNLVAHPPRETLRGPGGHTPGPLPEAEYVRPDNVVIHPWIPGIECPQGTFSGTPPGTLSRESSRDTLRYRKLTLGVLPGQPSRTSRPQVCPPGQPSSLRYRKLTSRSSRDTRDDTPGHSCPQRTSGRLRRRPELSSRDSTGAPSPGSMSAGTTLELAVPQTPGPCPGRTPRAPLREDECPPGQLTPRDPVLSGPCGTASRPPGTSRPPRSVP